MKILMNDCGGQEYEILQNLKLDAGIEVVYLAEELTDRRVQFVADKYIETINGGRLGIKEYAEYLLSICKEEGVNMFIPYTRMVELSNYFNMFREAGIKVLTPDDDDMFRLLNNKARTYAFLQPHLFEVIPKYKVFDRYNADGIDEFIEILYGRGMTPCIKFVEDVGGASFRTVVRSRRWSDLASKGSLSITEHDLHEMLKKEPLPKKLMVMEYCPGTEVSCDCLRTKSGNIVIPRFKLTPDMQHVVKEREVIAICDRILDLTNYNTPCNIQFKYYEKGFKLLEMNTRMSGGVMFASLATGVSLPVMAVRQAMGLPVECDMNWSNTYMYKEPTFMEDV